jgi:hypothetical protein
MVGRRIVAVCFIPRFRPEYEFATVRFDPDNKASEAVIGLPVSIDKRGVIPNWIVGWIVIDPISFYEVEIDTGSAIQ